MIGRADIEGSKSNVAMNAWLPQASYPCGNFSDTSGFRYWNIDKSADTDETKAMSPGLWYLDYPSSKGSLGPAFAAKTCTGRPGQASFWPYPLRKVSDLSELTFVHLRYRLTDVPPQPNSPSDCVPNRTCGPIINTLAHIRRIAEITKWTTIQLSNNS